ncbi:hypothetical protein [Streptomyces axinellae]|uniref:Uncharacterized protein n=1 Tax=Streptomyces axinellae TaxID=552788 RepID=A0ABN3Q6Q5_9ACTN
MSKLLRRTRRLPVPPANPYGAHPGAGWAPPAPLPGTVPRRKGVTTGRVFGTLVGGFAAYVFVVAPLLRWLL